MNKKDIINEIDLAQDHLKMAMGKNKKFNKDNDLKMIEVILEELIEDIENEGLES